MVHYLLLLPMSVGYFLVLVLLCGTHFIYLNTVKPVLSGHSKRIPNIDFQDRLSLNAGQKYCRMLQEIILQSGEHSAILLTFIKLPFAFILSIMEWPL